MYVLPPSPPKKKIFCLPSLDKYTGEDYLKMLSRTLRELWEQSPIVKHLEMWDLGKRGLTMHKALLAFSYVFINLQLFSRSVVSDSFGTP